MEQSKKYNPLFPLEYHYLNSKYEKFKQSISAIDYELDNSLSDKGLVPSLKPHGRLYTDSELRQRRKEFLERTREGRVSKFKINLQKELHSWDGVKQTAIFDRFDFEMSRGGFKDYTKENLEEVQNINKEDKASFDYMAAKYFNKFAVEKESIEDWTDRYVNTINVTRMEFGKEPIKDIDGLEPDF